MDKVTAPTLREIALNTGQLRVGGGRTPPIEESVMRQKQALEIGQRQGQRQELVRWRRRTVLHFYGSSRGTEGAECGERKT